MQLQFLGAATTVTGSQFLLTTGQAKVLVDCGMFQGSPNEAIRNRVPLAYDPATLDAILLTHAHLDHCGLIPYVVARGFKGPIYATAGTVELARLVLLDSGKLQVEFAKRGAKRRRRSPDKAAAQERAQQIALKAAIELAGEDDQVTMVPDDRLLATDRWPVMDRAALDRGAAWKAPNPEVALRYQPAALEVELEEPLYDVRDAEQAIEQFRSVRYDAQVVVAPGITATFVDAGHILGSAIIKLHVTDSPGGAERQLVFSGDLGRFDTPIIRDPTMVSDADYVLVESTYGGREHEPSEEAVRLLAEAVRAVAEADGVLLIPAFAIGRTQEVVWELDRLIERGEIPALPLYLDSPMASRASDVYRRHPEFYDEQTRRLLASGSTPLDYPNQTVTRSVDDSKAIATADRPYMIVASNGMLTGGRVVSHLRNLIDDPSATILFVGYQGKGTLGSHLQAGAKTVKLDGQVRHVRCRVRSISGFSAHADESELLDWLRHFGDGKQPGDPGFPRTVFLVHGDPDAQLAIAPKVKDLGFNVHVPRWRERVALG